VSPSLRVVARFVAQMTDTALACGYNGGIRSVRHDL
jgi:hypothetical protein